MAMSRCNRPGPLANAFIQDSAARQWKLEKSLILGGFTTRMPNRFSGNRCMAGTVDQAVGRVVTSPSLEGA
jgi:hypothetical protein